MATRKNQAMAVESGNQEPDPAEVQRYDSDRRRMILQYLPLLHFIARKVWTGFNETVTLEDLVSAGTVGLVEAMGKYDGRRGIKFSSFAYSRIRGAMIDELRMLDWFPRSMRNKAKKLERADQRLKLRLCRQPTDQEMAEELGMNPSDYLGQAREMANLSITSIEEMREIADSSLEGIDGKGTEWPLRSAENYAEEREEIAALARKVSTLPERQRRVLQLYFYDDMSDKEIAAHMGVTAARISQIRTRGIASLRSSLNEG